LGKLSWARHEKLPAGHILALGPKIRKLKRVTTRIESQCDFRWFEPPDEEVSENKRQLMEIDLVKLEGILEGLDKDIDAIRKNTG
jgi:hypothetical protein